MIVKTRFRGNVSGIPRAPELIGLALVLLLAAPGLPATPDDVSEQEIGHLIDHLGASGCQLKRNGKWYSSAAARSHLQRKYDYLLEKDLVSTTESFIERAASESSSSKPYLVKCGKAEAVTSTDWLTAELRRFRETRR